MLDGPDGQVRGARHRVAGMFLQSLGDGTAQLTTRAALFSEEQG